MAYRIIIEPEATAALRALRATDRARLLGRITAQLAHEPLRETTNRKPLREGVLAGWELRVQPWRVFYDVDEAKQRVYVIAVLRKDRETAQDVR